MKRNYYLILLSIMIFSCSQSKKISVLNNEFFYGLGIYLIDIDSLKTDEFVKLAEVKFPDFHKCASINDTIVANEYMITYEEPSDNNTPPNINSLSYFGKGLSDKEKGELQNYKGVISIVFRGTSENVFKKQKRINEFIEEIIQSKKVIIADYNSFEWFNSHSWKDNRVNNLNDSIIDIVHQIALHIYRDDEYCRAVTMGMDKFCLPDISINNFTCSNQDTYGNLVNSVIQTLAETSMINEDSTLDINIKTIKNKNIRELLSNDLKNNSKGAVRIKLKSIKPEEGDNYNKQFIISFDNPKFETPQQEQEKVIVDLFGAFDTIIRVKHDSLLLQTSEKARQRLPELMKLFNAGLAPGYSILVKAPFMINGGGNEWMWVEVTKWKSKSITGILQNDSYEIKDLKAGSIVNVNEDDIFDYILYKPDGTYEGNETGKIIENEK